jgi:hypothetical protein
MMRLFANSFRANAAYKNGIVAIGACAVIAICATGLAALAGLLPESESVAVTVTAMPLVDLQTALSRDIVSP